MPLCAIFCQGGFFFWTFFGHKPLHCQGIAFYEVKKINYHTAYDLLVGKARWR